MAKNFSEALKKTTKKKTTKVSKSKVPVLAVSKDMKDAVSSFIKAKADKKKAESLMDLHGTGIIDFVKDIQDTDGFNGTYRKSYKVPGLEDEEVTFVSSNKFSINPDDQEAIEGILGARFDSLIDVKHDVLLTSRVFTDEALQKKLMGLVGDHFDEFFETVTTLSVKEDFDKAVYTAVDEDGLKKLRTLVKPTKPALK